MLEVTSNPLVSIPSGFLFQDIQLGLLGVFGEIYRWVQSRRFRDINITAHCCRDIELQAQLGTWNKHLEGICRLWRQPITNAEPIKYMMLAHMGKETQADEEWEKIVSERISRTFYNVSMLHGLLTLHLLTDARSVLSSSTGSWNIGQTTRQPSPDPDMSIKLQHWAASWKGRRALIQSLHILKLYDNAPFSLPEQTMDPIAHMAMSTAALTLRCWIEHNTELCECGVVPGQPSQALKLEMEADKELWADEGGTAVLEGMPLCHCTLNIWEGRFATALEPRARDWEPSKAVLGSLGQHRKKQ